MMIFTKEMNKDYYEKILLKILAAENELDDFFIKKTIEIIQNMNYLDTVLIITFTQRSS